MITMANIEDRTDKMRTEMYLSCGSLWNLNERFGEGWGLKPDRSWFKRKLYRRSLGESE